MDAETLLKWKEAEVLVQINLGRFLEDEWSEAAVPIESALELFKGSKMRPYRAPGHIQPHDGSSERPEWVAEDDRVVVRYSPSWMETRADLVDWSVVDYYIVLPNIGGNND